MADLSKIDPCGTFYAPKGAIVDGWLAYPAYYPGEGDTAPSPTVFLGKEPEGHYSRVKKVRVEILEVK